MKLAVVGVTGMVGQVMLEVIEESKLEYSDILMVASERSVGKKISFKGKEYTVISMQDAVNERPDVAIFSAGGSASLEWAPKFAEVGTRVVDNSSAWRMDPSKKLVVPEINASAIGKDDYIIANPNCSTIQMVMALAPLHEKYKIKRLVISTYQSITGTGMKAVGQYESELAGATGDYEKAYHYKILDNCIPHCDVFLENDYTKEEMKLVHETRKILKDDDIRITATAVRVPVQGGHSEAVNAEFAEDFEINEVKSILNNTEGVIVLDDVVKNVYPMPLYAKHKDEVFVGRLRRDESQENTLNMWIVSDNLRKGAATNAVQIVQYLKKEGLVG
ncbi:aspartate-semialdehyde dehydrogenase [Portibacter lacus]|uniref:Aspartate-semialdehyde dehydrogenase n=1 Tax=Portibacter lacus TaxID=1099794 RepID=A0AA37SQ14_9BACT|nr:aspartate-semialdehyde dehydrogenase [Portibacter lacus]GLR17800.1 aspartate-semialdehyde dehydrogenase [Portibacter lacus]